MQKFAKHGQLDSALAQREQVAGKEPPRYTKSPSTADRNEAWSFVNQHYTNYNEMFEVWAENFKTRLDIVTTLGALEDRNIGADLLKGILGIVALAGVGSGATMFFGVVGMGKQVAGSLGGFAKDVAGAASSVEGSGQAHVVAEFKVEKLDNFLTDYNAMKANIMSQWNWANELVRATKDVHHWGEPGALLHKMQSIYGPLPKWSSVELDRVSMQIEKRLWKEYAQRNWKVLKDPVVGSRVTGYTDAQAARLKSEFKIDVQSIGKLWNLRVVERERSSAGYVNPGASTRHP